MTDRPWPTALALVAEHLATASPHTVLDQLDAGLRATDPAAVATLLLVDYRMTELRPVPASSGAASSGAASSSVPLDAGELGRVYATQRPARLTAESVAVPVSVHGDRLGVLVVRSAVLTEGDDAPHRLIAAATLVGQALLAAEHTTDTYRLARRTRSLSLSAEMQWDTLPGRSLDVGYATLAAQLEPAHQVVGDCYDWVAGAEGVRAVLVDGSGYGAGTAGTTVFTIEALRNARREGAGLADSARLADAALFARFGGSAAVSATLLELEPGGSELRIVQAGTSVALLADRTSARNLPLDPHPPLGAEEDHPYTAQTVRLHPGDRVVVASDGLAAATVGARPFGDVLDRRLRDYRLLGAAELVRAVVRDLVAFHDGRPQTDDAVLMCLDLRDARGPSA